MLLQYYSTMLYVNVYNIKYFVVVFTCIAIMYLTHYCVYHLYIYLMPMDEHTLLQLSAVVLSLCRGTQSLCERQKI